MDIYVKESDMPIKCRKCFCITTDGFSTRCKPLNVALDAGAYYERLPNCPLKPIEQWRLGSCDNCTGLGCGLNLVDNATLVCSNWRSNGTTQKLP